MGMGKGKENEKEKGKCSAWGEYAAFGFCCKVFTLIIIVVAPAI
jgi:hypothetical protein